MNLIPNPTKQITVPFRVDTITHAIEEIDSLSTDKNLTKKNNLLNIYTFYFPEFCSAGCNMIITLNPIDDQTTINIEMQRIMGGYDSWIEVQNANNHINNLLEDLYNYLQGNKDKILEDQKNRKTNNIQSVIIGGICISILIILLSLL